MVDPGRSNRIARAVALLGAATAFACWGVQAGDAGGPELDAGAKVAPEVGNPAAPAGNSTLQPSLEVTGPGPNQGASLELATPTAEWFSQLEFDEPLPGAEGALEPTHLVDHRSDVLLSLELPDDAEWLGFRELEAPEYQPRAVLEQREAKVALKWIPEGARGLQGRRVAVDGFALPVSIGSSSDRRFYLWPWPNGCCAGRQPRLDELVVVELPEGQVDTVSPLEPVRAVGVLDVGERLDLYGFAESLYRMGDAELMR